MERKQEWRLNVKLSLFQGKRAAWVGAMAIGLRRRGRLEKIWELNGQDLVEGEYGVGRAGETRLQILGAVSPSTFLPGCLLPSPWGTGPGPSFSEQLTDSLSQASLLSGNKVKEKPFLSRKINESHKPEEKILTRPSWLSTHLS